MTQAPWRLSAREVARAVAARECSAAEVARSVLDRLEQVNPLLNAVVCHDAGETLRQAREVDGRLARGEALPLAGVPVTVKDNLWVGGWRVTQGSRLFRDFIAPQDAWAVARLRALGAVIVGITNCSEFACKGVTSNLVYGATRSPWDLRLTPGGSSGGAVSATAAGIGALALATDAGGSTRRPAAHAGLVGMKPTFGVIPCGPGFEEPTFGLSVIGQVGRDVADVAWLWQCLLGYDGADWGAQRCAPLDPPRLGEAPPRTLRVAWSADLGCGYPVDGDVLAALEQRVRGLERDGYSVAHAAPQWPADLASTALLALQHAGLAALHGAALDADGDALDSDLAAQVRQGRGYGGVEIAQVLLMRERIHAACARFFEQFDLLLCPTTPTVSWPVERLGPPEIGGLPAGPRGHAVFTPLFNFAQVPACSVPAGLVRGLPVGLQVVGPRYADASVLAMAAHLERLGGPAARCALWDQFPGNTPSLIP
ncbi:amidase [Alicycliphilus denitrificans]|uniref:amidase n=1 Tax=Alicycliphilus denitrificans TaxID=179636 RepID=UPI00384C721E